MESNVLLKLLKNRNTNLKTRLGNYALVNEHLLGLATSEEGKWCYKTYDPSLARKYHFERGEYYYRLQINDIKNITAYDLDIWATYNGLLFSVGNWDEEIVSLVAGSDECIIALGSTLEKAYYEVYPSIEVPIDEIPDIWEKRTPIEGFKFDVEPIVYLKNDGVWLEEQKEVLTSETPVKGKLDLR